MALQKPEDAPRSNDLPKTHCPNGKTLSESLNDHLRKEKVSFHTPGHKNRLRWTASEDICRYDLTELPGLDDLARPRGVLALLETRLAQVWDAQSSVLSVNGASNALIAAMLAIRHRGRSVLVPRNCHRSIVNGLILSGLEPVWYEPVWSADWGIWSHVDVDVIKNTLAQFPHASGDQGLAGVVLVSPTYTGETSDTNSIATACHREGVPLIVDEAHGAHFLTSQTRRLSALASGADLVVQSLHKNLDAFTQCGAIHISWHGSERFGFSQSQIRTAMSTTQSSSPSYILLRSVDEMLSGLESGETVDRLAEVHKLGTKLKQQLSSFPFVSVYPGNAATSPLHILIRLKGLPGNALIARLAEAGLFAEGTFGDGVLLLLGVGTTEADVQALYAFCAELEQDIGEEHRQLPLVKPPSVKQILAPRQAALAASVLVPAQEAVGMVAAECIATCPPGWPAVVPGQQLDEDVLCSANVEFIKVVSPDTLRSPE